MEYKPIDPSQADSPLALKVKDDIRKTLSSHVGPFTFNLRENVRSESVVNSSYQWQTGTRSCWDPNRYLTWNMHSNPGHHRNGIFWVVRITNFQSASCELSLNYVDLSYGSGCLGGDTKIRMANGSFKKISEIRNDEYVWNPVTKSAAQVFSNYCPSKKSSLYQIVNSKGRKIIATEDHIVFTDNGPKRAKELNKSATQYGEEIISNLIPDSMESPETFNLLIIASSESPDDHWLESQAGIGGDLWGSDS